MRDVATVESRNMVIIPARIRKKYRLGEGRKIRFVDMGGGILMVPVLTLKELDGSGGAYAKEIVEGVRELEVEHGEEANRLTGFPH